MILPRSETYRNIADEFVLFVGTESVWSLWELTKFWSRSVESNGKNDGRNGFSSSIENDGWTSVKTEVDDDRVVLDDKWTGSELPRVDEKEEEEEENNEEEDEADWVFDTNEEEEVDDAFFFALNLIFDNCRRFLDWRSRRAFSRLRFFTRCERAKHKVN